MVDEATWETCEKKKSQFWLTFFESLRNFTTLNFDITLITIPRGLKFNISLSMRIMNWIIIRACNNFIIALVIKQV